MSGSYRDQRLEDFLDLVATKGPAPAAGSVAALVVALAAGLTSKSARASITRLPQAEGFVAKAEKLRERAAALADADAEAYQAVVAAGQSPELPGALTRAAEVPTEVAEVGARTAEVAAVLALDGHPKLRADAASAAVLATTAARAAAHLVAINAQAGADAGHLLDHAQRSVESATRSADRALPRQQA